MNHIGIVSTYPPHHCGRAGFQPDKASIFQHRTEPNQLMEIPGPEENKDECQV
jgi:hypothetical protein